MSGIILLIIVGAVVYYKMLNTPDVRLVKELSRGKTEEQAKVITYFVQKNRWKKNLSDDEYLSLVRKKCDSLKLKERALGKIGLDEDQVNEISPAMFEGFVFDNAYAKKSANGEWVSSSYQVSWVFFGSEQIYLYAYTLNMDDDNKKERTDEFFYRDVTSFSTASETETAKDNEGKQIKVDSNKFALVVPGDKLYLSMDGVKDSESIIQGVKQKLREKKSL